MSVIDKLKRNNRNLISFNHGLGDLLLFLPVFEELQRQVGKRIYLGVSRKRNLTAIYPKAVVIDDICDDVRSMFDFVYNVIYPEPLDDSVSKPYLCAYKELGMDKFLWKPYTIKNEKYDENSKRVGVNFFGITGSKGDVKFCSTKTAERIWKEIQMAGYEPFELYQRVSFTKDYYRDNDVPDHFSLANDSNSLRFKEPDLNLIVDEAKKCRFIVSTDSGILYLGVSLLGRHNVIGLENKKKINKYLPTKIIIVDIANYKCNEVYDYLSCL